MLSAFSLSSIFLVSYVISKITNEPIPFGGEGMIRDIYFFILISHILLSIPVLPLALFSIYREKQLAMDQKMEIITNTLSILKFIKSKALENLFYFKILENRKLSLGVMPATGNRPSKHWKM